MRIAYFLCIMLTGCLANIPERPCPIVTVKVPVKVSCIDSVPQPPTFVTDEQLRNMTDGEFVTSLHIDRLQRRNYESELEAVISACKF